jgi:hypothetical protein
MSATRPNRTLTRHQRDTLYQEAVSAMDTGVIELLLRRDQGEGAREAADSARLWMQLLDDLGWERDDPRDRFPLTVPDDELLPVIRRVVEQIDAELAAVARGDADGDLEPIVDEDLDLRLVCAGLLET